MTAARPGDSLARQKQVLAANQTATRKFSASLARRLYRNTSRHVNGMAAVAIPVAVDRRSDDVFSDVWCVVLAREGDGDESFFLRSGSLRYAW